MRKVAALVIVTYSQGRRAWEGRKVKIMDTITTKERTEAIEALKDAIVTLAGDIEKHNSLDYPLLGWLELKLSEFRKLDNVAKV